MWRRRRSAEDWPRVLVTGGDGKIGRAVARRWPRGRLTSFDLPGGDVHDSAALTAAARGHDAILHLAWDATEDYNSGTISPENLAMALGALEAACAAGVGRVVLASSVHADAWWPPGEELLDPATTPVPTSPYGASKVAIEGLARHFAAHRGLETVAIRFGGVTADDARPAEARAPRGVAPAQGGGRARARGRFGAARGRTPRPRRRGRRSPPSRARLRRGAIWSG